MKKALFLWLLINSSYFFELFAQISTPTKIVGGEVTSIQTTPYQAALMYGNSIICGGVIIGDANAQSTQWIMTAAHCADLFNQVKVGIDQRSAAVFAPSYKVKRVITHPHFNAQTLQNDIALVELTTPIVYNDTQKPVNFVIPDGGLLQKEAVLSVSGFGATAYGAWGSEELRKVTLDFVPLKEAQKMYNFYKTFSVAEIITAGGSGKDACQGDSGGPLIALEEKTPFLVGLVSFGPESCGEVPGAYTRVQYFADWIFAHTQIAPSLPFAPMYAQRKAIFSEAELFLPELPNHLLTWQTTDNIKITNIAPDHVRLRVITEGEGKISGFYAEKLIFEQYFDAYHNNFDKKWGCQRSR